MNSTSQAVEGPHPRHTFGRGGGVGAGSITEGASLEVGTKVPFYSRVGRLLYALLASAFVAGVLTQVFFAGMGAFGADWDWHTTFVHVLEPLPLLMVAAAFVGRMSWGLRLLPFGLVFLIGLQYALADSVVPTAALHPVNAILILLLGAGMARRAWSSVSGRRRG